MSQISIDLDEKFPTLKAAPSIESVIHWQAPANQMLEPESLRAALTQRLPAYPNIQDQQDIQMGMEVPNGSPEFFQRTKWSGFRLQDQQGHYMAQFTPTGVVFSRLKPYVSWESFKTEALCFWELFRELAQPTMIQRLGVRYINRIPLATGEQPSQYLKTTPSILPGLDLLPATFFHQETYPVPGYPYQIQWVRTIQPSMSSAEDRRGLIVDIDVFATELLQLEEDNLIQTLSEMRWLKNKVFFSCLTDLALQEFGADSHA